uniref:G protein n=1 Tax=Jeilongvirus sp. TaxID=2686070 RepID=A0A8F7GNY5_9MONO|nr:G protein [Jeilongvirus sp.]QXU63484.1 G protein [Jeilongvirus sp.]
MADYYKTGGFSTTIPKKIKDKAEESTSILAYSSLVLGIISVLVLIALNATNIVLSIKRDAATAAGSTSGSTGESNSQNNHLVDLIEGDLLPKTNLINNVVSYNIPSSLTQIYNYMRRDLMQACTPKFDHNGGQCPVGPNPYHSGSFSLLTRNFLQRCPDPNENIIMENGVHVLDFPSFVPGPTKPGGCMRDPSFSIGPKIFGYTHNVVGDGCDNIQLTTQYVSIGRVTDVDSDMPYFETLTQWYIDDGLNRKTCTVAVADDGTWIACIISTESDEQDYRTLGIGRVFIGYMDIYGRRMTWYLDENDISFSHNFAAIFFSVGSGIVESGKVYFLMYGGLVAPVSGNVMCSTPGCSNPSQTLCDEASKPKSRDGRQMVNAIMVFDDNPGETPRPKVKVLKPSQSWFGARGRLFTSAYDAYAFIYIASETWHALPQIGMVLLDDDLDVFWVENVATSRPGTNGCDFGNRCPKVCLTGYYTDLFPLDSIYQFAITITLKNPEHPVNPVLQVVSQNKVLYETTLVTANQSAHFTTTSCFKYTRSLWCLSIVALEPATVGARQPVPFLYRVPLSCKAKVLQTGLMLPRFEKTNRTQIMTTQELNPPQIPIKPSDKEEAVVSTPNPNPTQLQTPTPKVPTTPASTAVTHTTVKTTSKPSVTTEEQSTNTTTRQKREDTTSAKDIVEHPAASLENSRSMLDGDIISDSDRSNVRSITLGKSETNVSGNIVNRQPKNRRAGPKQSKGQRNQSKSDREMVIKADSINVQSSNQNSQAEENEENGFSRFLAMLMPIRFDHYIYHGLDKVDYDSDIDAITDEKFTTGDDSVIMIKNVG